MFKKLLVSVLILAFVVMPVSFALPPNEVADEIISYYNENNSDLSFWEMGALYSAGIDVSDDEFWFDIEQPSQDSLPTEFAKYIFFMLMKDDREGAVEYIEQLAAKQSVSGGFSNAANQHIWAMLALDAAGVRYNRPTAISFLNSFKGSGGGFCLEQNDSAPYADITAMALTALARYDDNEARGLISGAVSFLKNKWKNGDSIDNANTISVMISGLCAVGEDVLSSSWLKDGKSLFDELCSFKLEDGSFKYMADDTETDRLATAQALIAACDVINKSCIWSGFSALETATASLRIEGIETTLFSGEVTVISTAPTVLDAILTVLDSLAIEYKINEFYGSQYISSIKGEREGQFGGYEGWLYIVDGEEPNVGMGDFMLENGNEILLYYGGYAPATLIAEYSISPSKLYSDEPIKITLSASYFDWDSNQMKTVQIEGAEVVINGIIYLTDETGTATIDDIKTAGIYSVNVSKQNNRGYPAIVRIPAFEIVVEKAKETTADSKSYGGTTGGSIHLPAQIDNAADTQAEEKTDEKQAGAASAGETVRQYNDYDQISDWAVQYIEKARKHKIMTGNDNNEFLPRAQITRAEFAALLIRLLDIPAAGEDMIFDDVSADEWYYVYISSAKAHGIISGYDDNTFRPNGAILREEAAVIINRAFKMNGEHLSFNDWPDISDWASEAVSNVTAVGIMHGFEERFEPKGSVTREMAAAIAVRLLEADFERAVK